MLRNIRNFSKTIWAKIIMGFIIIAFATWGMGGMFSSGNSNNLAKINKSNISIDDLLNYLRDNNVSEEIIRKNLDKNVLEQILSQLITQKILESEMKENNIMISDKALYEKIKKDERFFDANNNFSRTEYEKYMLINNTSAVDFEQALKAKEKVKLLFEYVSGGTLSPFFLTNNVFSDQMKEIDIEYINLENIYNDKNKITEVQINDYLNKNIELFKQKIINYKYMKIDPNGLTGANEYNQEFFNKIDEIENRISEGANFNSISNELDLPVKIKIDFNIQDNETSNSDFYYDIFDDEDINKPKLIEKDDLFVLYVIEKIDKRDPNVKSKKTMDTIKFMIQQEFKINYNKNLINKITNNSFDEKEFYKIVDNNKDKILIKKIKSKNDNSIFDQNSLELLYSMQVNKFAIVTDINKNIFLTYIKNIKKNNLKKNTVDYENFNQASIIELQSSFYETYDNLLSNKYKVTINQKSLDKVKNLFE